MEPWMVRVGATLVIGLLISLALIWWAGRNVDPRWICRCEDSDNCECGGAYGDRRD